MLASAKSYRVNFAKGLTPDPDMSVTEWADKHRHVAEGTSTKSGKWRNATTPYLKKPMDCISPSHPCMTVSMLKSVQCGGSEMITNLVGFVSDVAPGPFLIVHPTKDAGADWDREKLTPTIEATPRMREKIKENKGRQGGSTTKHKKFPGGFLAISGANSAAGLRQKSIRYLAKDDWDEWPHDVNGQGDPDKMANARQVSYLASGTAKRLQVSSPTNKSTSRIHKAYYEESHRCIWKMPCPHCDAFQEFRFFPVSKEPFKGGLRFNDAPPYNAHYVCELNGCIIEHHEKLKMLAKGDWFEAESEKVFDPETWHGDHVGFKISTIFSPFVPWDEMAKEFLSVKDKPQELKTFINLWLGEAWEERGDAPDSTRLLGLREPYAAGRMPLGALLITAGVDVQKDGFFYEVVAWGVGKTSWLVDKGFLPGSTDQPTSWKQLTDLYDRQYENPWGQFFRAEHVAIDSRYNTHMVYAWVRGKDRAMAVMGVHGAYSPILGTPTKIDVGFSGKKLGSLRVWPVGDWQSKLEFYSYLRLEGIKEGKDADPWGYCHFHMGCDENYFKQLTSESLVWKERAGKQVQEWQTSGENHFLDCRKYNLACAERLGLSRFTVSDWERLAAMRNVPVETLQGDLLSLQAQLNSQPAPKAQEESGDENDDTQPEPPKPRPPVSPGPAAPPKAAKTRIKARMKF